MTRRLIILGSTGSIGTQALDVVEHLNALHKAGEFPHRVEVVGLAAGSNAELLAAQAARFGCTHTALATNPRGTGMLPVSTPSTSRASTMSLSGSDAAERLVRSVECDLVLAAMVGSAGVPATLAAISLGRDIALANKETLVAAGELVVREASRTGSRLLPVDSEHAGLWQCLQSLDNALVPPVPGVPRVRRVTLTASGGPFRTWPLERIRNATPKEALNHPTWSMGPKVTVDSASLMNKALEIIEAHWLFGLAPEQIGALIHPQSTVHALAEMVDGSVIAQLSATDMRHPIQQALAWPRRVAPCSTRLDLATLRSLEFEAPDLERFPALGFAHRAMAAGGTAGAILNAANEMAVQRFLASAAGPRPMPFGLIPTLVREAMDAVPATPIRSLDDVHLAEAAARAQVASRLRDLEPAFAK
jgi:1-deoxy-D-xylulose-5-phosphate reductoisomerase